MDKTAKEITVRQVLHWPNEGLLSCGKLSVMHDVVNMIGATNWAPTHHNSNITPTLAKLIYQIGTKSKLNFGEYVFIQTMKHAGSFAMELPIALPFLIIGIIVKKYSEIGHVEEMKNNKPLPLTLDKKLFVVTHVSDIELFVIAHPCLGLEAICS